MAEEPQVRKLMTAVLSSLTVGMDINGVLASCGAILS
jgi:hypothetical protein